MNFLQFNSSDQLAECALQLTMSKLGSSIADYGNAVWVLAGGSTPLSSYNLLASKHQDDIDWAKLWLAVGDERQVDFNSPESNSGVIIPLFDSLPISKDHIVVPEFATNLPAMANNYSMKLSWLPKGSNQLPRFDVIWLGVGEDGHTLSLFPGHEVASSDLVIPVVNAPKEPSRRISLSLTALLQVRYCFILAVGENKAAAVAGLINKQLDLPITLAVAAIEKAGGEVCLLADNLATTGIRSVL